jgi:hypothetical protein
MQFKANHIIKAVKNNQEIIRIKNTGFMKK